MDQKEIEALLRAKYEDGGMGTGLFNAGVQYVVMDNVDGELTFTWFDTMNTIDDLVNA